MSAGLVILILKIAVVLVTILLVMSLIVLAKGHYRWHGRINIVFFVLTLTALVGLEVVARLVAPKIFDDFFEAHQAKPALRTHLMFSMPAAAVMVVMLVTGLRRSRSLHVPLGVLFLGLWIGTFITGVFFLPHANP